MGRLFLVGAAALTLLLSLAAGTAMCAERMFVGKVVRFDAVSHVLSVKGSGTVVTFDTSTIAVAGYRSVEDIRKGDTIGVVYTPSGVKVVRAPSGKGPSAAPREVAPGPAPHETASKAPAPPQEKKGATMTRKLQRRQQKGNGQGFEDCDVNKDGKVTPVELSVVIPDVTMGQFKEYDADHNGCLNLAEFAKALSRAKQQNTNGPTN